MVELPDGEKICLLVLTQYTNVTDTQTDGQTLQDGALQSLCKASCCKNKTDFTAQHITRFWPIVFAHLHFTIQRHSCSTDVEVLQYYSFTFC